MPPSEVTLQRKLAQAVNAYLSASKDGDQEQQEQTMRQLCSVLQYLLSDLLRDFPEWDGCIDGILPATDVPPNAIEISRPLRLTVRGWAIWTKAPKGPSWVEPFLAIVQLPDVDGASVEYEINFADASQKLGELPYGKKVRRSSWFYPDRWRFSFSNRNVTDTATKLQN